ncbi:MAG: type II toxin-antitoxin system VapC family toxin [Candidatus Accumulibacter sp.]|uniref:type II toxin-antitoxin system VapC family toxin n=1 Tax=Accumulibacter sp. TaxID=2053492 RepID=UPI001A5A21D7|nr:type II toxin-antitoxin system VapC family toxin [Accumulibacter sp.]MBL8394351.1 type II toxin-antitoxin system VapC family toxin [Accumulibacter sp.]
MLYLDTSFVAPLVLNEDASLQVEAFLAKQAAGSLAVSQWTRVEFCSLVAREVRMKHFSTQTAEAVIAEFEVLVQESCQVWLPSAVDYDLARTLLAQFDSGLRGGDALHLAIARNQGADKVLTLDEGLLKTARLLKIPAARGIR